MMHSVLENIERPDDLRSLSPEDVRRLAAEIRQRLVDVTSKNGGHLASSLGAVEIILALHSVFDFSYDRLVFDVGHQGYAHKLITGRNAAFDTLRKFGGISGFPKREESIYDAHDSGHASDSLSIACGLAKAYALNGDTNEVVALIGDASLSGGLAFEALNQIGHDQYNITIVLNDNEMSISKSVGALSLYLGKLRMSRPYTVTRDTLEGSLERIGKAGRVLVNAGEAAKSSFKKLVVPGMFFEDMGIKYIGPIDGHNIFDVLDAFSAAKGYRGPIIVHTVTQKGRGFEPAEKKPELFHGVSSYDPKTGELDPKNGLAPTFTQAFGSSLLDEAERDDAIVALTAAMPTGTGLDGFAACFSERFIDVGIAEEHAVAMAAGLALAGKKPVVVIYSAFLQRAFDQLAVDVALQRLHVVFCLDRSGLVGEDGSTHHGLLDLVYLRALPAMRIIAPSDARMLSDALHTALSMNDGPVAIRYPRGATPDGAVPDDYVPQILPFGIANLLRSGADVALLALGKMIPLAAECATLLAAQGIEASVYDMIWVKPIDEDAVRAATATRLIVTLEDGTTSGGFGSAVLETLSGVAERPVVLTLGVPDEFCGHGCIERLFESLGLTPAAVTEQIVEALNA
ncbi:MAG: 1-deoxy-D-xylulose-5-phosphate synthase [Coriobacteriales bacterium]|jgi:1-deoxy-D-xylulose-5-phosphate synthase|nr:1-deoxy-D-xylulose-5-phosphate synthase [Coriobacteriales bacterium]